MVANSWGARLLPSRDERRAHHYRHRHDGAAGRWAGFCAGLDEGGIHDFEQALDAGGFPHGRDGCGNGGFEARPIFAAQNAKMPRRLIPLHDQAGVRAGTGGVARVAPQVLHADVQAVFGWVYPGPAKALPKFAQGDEQSERNVGRVSAHGHHSKEKRH